MRIAIVGAGLSGLTVAFRLSATHEVTLIESSPRSGGQLATAREEGFVVELGAEGFVARSEAVPRLAADLGMGASADGSQLLDQATTLSFAFDGTALHPLAPGEAAAALDFQVARTDRGAGIRTFAGGMAALAEALDARLEASAVRYLGVAAEALELDGGRVRLDGVAYDAVVLAVPSAVAALLLRPLLGADPFVPSATVSSVNVSLAFARDQVGHPLDGTGFVVTPAAGVGFRACSFSSSKFTHRAPPDRVLLRAFFRPTDEELAEDIDWVGRAARALERPLAIAGPPLLSWTATWPDALPVFDGDYALRVTRLERWLAERRILLAGSAFHGSGIDAAVRSAEGAARELLRGAAAS